MPVREGVLLTGRRVGGTVRDRIVRLLKENPVLLRNNAALVLACWTNDPDYPLPPEAQAAIGVLKELAYAGKLRSPESFRRARQSVTPEVIGVTAQELNELLRLPRDELKHLMEGKPRSENIA